MGIPWLEASPALKDTEKKHNVKERHPFGCLS